MQFPLHAGRAMAIAAFFLGSAFLPNTTFAQGEHCADAYRGMAFRSSSYNTVKWCKENLRNFKIHYDNFAPFSADCGKVWSDVNKFTASQENISWCYYDDITFKENFDSFVPRGHDCKAIWNGVSNRSSSKENVIWCYYQDETFRSSFHIIFPPSRNQVDTAKIIIKNPPLPIEKPGYLDIEVVPADDPTSDQPFWLNHFMMYREAMLACAARANIIKPIFSDFRPRGNNIFMRLGTSSVASYWCSFENEVRTIRAEPFKPRYFFVPVGSEIPSDGFRLIKNIHVDENYRGQVLSASK